MRKVLLLVLAFAISGLLACGNKAEDTSAQPAAVQAPAAEHTQGQAQEQEPAAQPAEQPAEPTAEQPAEPTGEQPAAQPEGSAAPAGNAAVPEKVEVHAEPGRTVVITDLKVGTGKTGDAGTLKFNTPGSQLQYKPDNSGVKLRPAAGSN